MQNVKDLQLILASASPRRIEIMQKHGLSPIVYPTDVDETLPEDADMRSSVLYLALKKALAAERKILREAFTGAPVLRIEGFSEPPIIIAADTIVYDDKLGIIGKPADKEEASDILRALNGGVHYVVTGVAVVRAGRPQRKAFYDITEVHFKQYTEEDIEKYVSTPEPYDKAGGYAIQGAWGKHVDFYRGDYDNIVGFPWERIEEELENGF